MWFEAHPGVLAGIKEEGCLLYGGGSVRGTPCASHSRPSSASAPATSSLFRNAFSHMTSYATRSRPASPLTRLPLMTHWHDTYAVPYTYSLILDLSLISIILYIRPHLQVDPYPFLFGSPARYGVEQFPVMWCPSHITVTQCDTSISWNIEFVGSTLWIWKFSWVLINNIMYFLLSIIFTVWKIYCLSHKQEIRLNCLPNLASRMNRTYLNNHHTWGHDY